MQIHSLQMETYKVIEHFMSPRNVERLPEADGVGSFGDPSCEDSLAVLFK